MTTTTGTNTQGEEICRETIGIKSLLTTVFDCDAFSCIAVRTCYGYSCGEEDTTYTGALVDGESEIGVEDNGLMVVEVTPEPTPITYMSDKELEEKKEEFVISFEVAIVLLLIILALIFRGFLVKGAKKFM